MWGVSENGPYYGELDGYEFGSCYQLSATDHYANYPSTNGCRLILDPFSTNFGDGNQRTFTLSYTPDEIDWWASTIASRNTPLRSDTKYYIEDNGVILFESTTYAPYYYNNNLNDDFDNLYENCAFARDIPMWLIVDDAVQQNAHPSDFPVYQHIESIKYWVAGNCTEPANVTANDINNTTSLQFNAFTGTTVTIDGSTDGSINIPNIRSNINNSDKGWCHGNLEAIAINSVHIKGSFTNNGYLVLKADGNMCNEYPGPYPYDDVKGGHRPIKFKNSNDTSSTNPNLVSADSLAMQVKNSLTNAQFTLTLTNVSANEENQNGGVTVYNMLGQEVYKGNILVRQNNELNINLSNEAKGVYIILLQTKDKILHGKIVLQ